MSNNALPPNPPPNPGQVNAQGPLQGNDPNHAQGNPPGSVQGQAAANTSGRIAQGPSDRFTAKINAFCARLPGAQADQLVREWKRDSQKLTEELLAISKLLSEARVGLEFISNRVPDIGRDPSMQRLIGAIGDMHQAVANLNLASLRFSDHHDLINDVRSQLSDKPQEQAIFNQSVAPVFITRQHLISTLSDAHGPNPQAQALAQTLNPPMSHAPHQPVLPTNTNQQNLQIQDQQPQNQQLQNQQLQNQQLQNQQLQSQSPQNQQRQLLQSSPVADSVNQNSLFSPMPNPFARYIPTQPKPEVTSANLIGTNKISPIKNPFVPEEQDLSRSGTLPSLASTNIAPKNPPLGNSSVESGVNPVLWDDD